MSGAIGLRGIDDVLAGKASNVATGTAQRFPLDQSGATTCFAHGSGNKLAGTSAT
jgi:hypothetical protein